MGRTIISDCKTYRYTLHRRIPSPLRWVRKCVFIMLNPSTADAEVDDPTIRRCISFANREGCTELIVINLFALRSTNPKNLKGHNDPYGPENNKHFEEALKGASIVVCAWGANQMVEKGLSRVRNVLTGPDINLKSLGLTKHGKPRHPLYVKSDQQLMDFSV